MTSPWQLPILNLILFVTEKNKLPHKEMKRNSSEQQTIETECRESG